MADDIIRPVAGAGKRDEAIEELFFALYPRLARTAFGLVGDWDLAEQLAQEAFLRLRRRWSWLRDPQAAPAYLQRTVVNLARSQVRRLVLERRVLSRGAPGGPARADGDGGDLTSDMAIRRAIESLPYRKRACVVLRYLVGLSEAETATALGISVGTVKSPVRAVAYGGSQFWLACGSSATTFLRLDPASGRVLAEGGPAHNVSAVAATADGVWYANDWGVSGLVGTGARLSWVHASDSAIPVSLGYTDSLIYGQGFLWSFTNDEGVAKIDPATGRIVRIYGYQSYDPRYSMGLDFFTVGLDSLWFLAEGQAQATSVLRVSLATGRPQGEVSGVGSCGEPCWQIYVASGSVWVPTQHHVTRIDPVPRERRGRPLSRRPLRRTGSR